MAAPAPANPPANPPGDGVDDTRGNNVSSVSSKGQHRKWCFTQHLEEEPTVAEERALAKTLDKNCVKWCFQTEICPETGGFHYQGFASFKNARQLGGVVKLLKPHGKHPHCSVAKAKDDEDSRTYCSKEDTRAPGHSPYEGGWPARLKDPLEGKELRPFQAELKALIATEPDDRKVIWYWETKGNIGKTTIAKHLCMKDPTCIFVNGRAADIKNMIMVMKEKGKEVKTVLFGIPRTAQDYVSYAALEEVKDGIFFSGKYEAGMVIMNTPHVIVMANFPPDMTKLSADRWDVRDLNEQPLWGGAAAHDLEPEEAGYAQHGIPPAGAAGPADFAGVLDM